MTKEELKKHIDGLDDNAEIIVITKEQANVIPKQHCQEIRIGSAVVWVMRKFLAGVWMIAVAWVLQAPLDHLPKPDAVVLTAAEKIQYVMTHTDYNFSYSTNFGKYPSSYVAYDYKDATYFTPVSGLSPEVIQRSGSFDA
jgi:hypothetical protein